MDRKVHPLYRLICSVLEFITSGSCSGEQLIRTMESLNSVLCDERDYWIDLVGQEKQDFLEHVAFFLLYQLSYMLGPQSASALSDLSPLKLNMKSKSRPNFPKKALFILQDWLRTHKDHPYPSMESKERLRDITGLSIRQISDWFINARRRYC